MLKHFVIFFKHNREHIEKEQNNKRTKISKSFKIIFCNLRAGNRAILLVTPAE